MMILDLSECEVNYERDVNPDITSAASSTIQINYLTNEKWVVIQAATSPEADSENLTDNHFDSKIHTRIKLYDDNDVWIVPLTSLVAPCYVIYNKSYREHNDQHNVYTDYRTAYIVKPMSQWGDMFLPPLKNSLLMADLLQI
jgi:hypothetical protein